MAKKRTTRSKKKRVSRSGSKEQASRSLDDFAGGLENDGGATAETTGRMIMTVLDPDKESVKSALKSMANMTGMSAASSRVMYSSDVENDELAESDSSDANYVVLEKLGVVVLNGSPDQVMASRAATPQDQNVVVEPELWNYSLGSKMPDADLMSNQFDDPDMSLGKNEEVSREFLLGARKMLDLLLELSLIHI